MRGIRLDQLPGQGRFATLAGTEEHDHPTPFQGSANAVQESGTLKHEHIVPMKIEIFSFYFHGIDFRFKNKRRFHWIGYAFRIHHSLWETGRSRGWRGCRHPSNRTFEGGAIT